MIGIFYLTGESISLGGILAFIEDLSYNDWDEKSKL
jgi:hypothetical protein